jgi:outer membrane murein-binding lipoprotein Lpp
MKRIALVIAAATALVTALAGCASQTRTETDYGRAVREMINAQVADPATLTNPSTAIVTGADPDMVNAAIKAMRAEVAEPRNVQRDIIVKVGGR